MIAVRIINTAGIFVVIVIRYCHLYQKHLDTTSVTFTVIVFLLIIMVMFVWPSAVLHYLLK